LKAFNSLQRLSRLLKSGGKFIWATPPRSDLIIYDFMGSKELGKILLPGVAHSVFSTRGEIFYFHPLIVILAFWTRISKGVSGRQAYDITCLKWSRPRVVLTYIDNSPNLFIVSKHVKARFFVVQNGFRSHMDADHMLGLPNFYCFGERDFDLYASHKVPVAEMRPIGSVKASYFRDEMAPALPNEPSYDVCLISSYQEGMEKEDFLDPRPIRQPLIEGTRRTCEYLARFQKEKKLRLIVAGWQNPGQNLGEIAFFRKYFGNEIEVVSTQQEFLNSYRLAYQSRVVLSYGSTLGYEVLSWGRKAFFFYMPEEKNYRLDHPHSALFQIRDASYEEFCGKLNTILEMPIAKYQEEVQKDTDYVMARGSEPAYQVLRKLIHQALGADQPAG
jgi:surface carbohydrate biosynthesis protein